MKAMTHYILAILFTISLSGCEDLFNTESELPEQELYFQYEYINHAWGYHHSGWLLDSSGNVYCYSLPENWNFPDSLGYITLEEQKFNISQADSVCLLIDKNDLANKIEEIENASNGALSDARSVMADAGSWSYYAFIYEEEASRYLRVLLKQKGDWEIDNTSQAAEDLFDWMDSIQEEIHNQ